MYTITVISPNNVKHLAFHRRIMFRMCVIFENPIVIHYILHITDPLNTIIPTLSPLYKQMSFDLFNANQENEQKSSNCFIAFLDSVFCCVICQRQYFNFYRLKQCYTFDFLIINKRAERGHPRRTPLDILISSVNHPFSLTQLLTLVYNVETHLQNSLLHQNTCKHSKRNSQLRQSDNAFLKSD